jgi:hypothetical protein
VKLSSSVWAWEAAASTFDLVTDVVCVVSEIEVAMVHAGRIVAVM